VCAFTWIGFKYNHEMPMDKATQISRGPDHGIPKWCPGGTTSSFLHPTLSSLHPKHAHNMRERDKQGDPQLPQADVVSRSLD